MIDVPIPWLVVVSMCDHTASILMGDRLIKAFGQLSYVLQITLGLGGSLAGCVCSVCQRPTSAMVAISLGS